MNEPTIEASIAWQKFRIGRLQTKLCEPAEIAQEEAILASLERLKSLDAQPVPVEPEPLNIPYTQRELLRDRQLWINYGRTLQSALQRAQEEIHIVFDGPPSHESGRFVEVETADGKSVNVGRWEKRGEYWHLIIGGKK